MAVAIPQSVKAYDFSAVAPSGQTLYYNISGSIVLVTSQHSEPSYGEHNLHYYSEAPTGDLTIPESVIYDGTTYPVASVGEGAFHACMGLTSVTIPNSVTSIGYGAFTACMGLTSMTIPNSVTLIGEMAFADCSGLTSVTIPNSVTSIDNMAFGNCSSLTSVAIPNSVTSIGYGTFFYCGGLTSIEVSSGNTVYDSRDNCNAIIESASNTLICGCKNTTIPNSVTSIGESAFNGHSGLTSVTIPNSVTSIGYRAFYECNGLTEIICWRSIAPSLGEETFSGVTSTIPVYIPCGSIALYQSEWTYFSNFIEDCSDGINDVNDESIQICSHDGCIVVEGAEDNTVWLYDAVGRLLATRQDDYLALRFDVPTTGTYLIKIGNHPARKVVVEK